MWCVIYRDKLTDRLEVCECENHQGATNLYEDMRIQPDTENVTLVELEE